ncbi:MAG TPA: hypothetical protein VMZ69_08115 [Saprospiraceae bacterium]|nr:hypothetical protein [Saprospiraceae bacterium]
MKTLIPFLIIFTACNSKQIEPVIQTPVDLGKTASEEIRSADIAMSDQANRDGFNKTLLEFADDSIIKPKEGEFPVIGKKALEDYWKGKEGTKALSWRPFRSEAAKSGDIGYTVGNWTLVTSDSTYHGNYITIWKKQPDGQWKWVVDGGNATPAPK